MNCDLNRKFGVARQLELFCSGNEYYGQPDAHKNKEPQITPKYPFEQAYSGYQKNNPNKNESHTKKLKMTMLLNWSLRNVNGGIFALPDRIPTTSDEWHDNHKEENDYNNNTDFHHLFHCY